MGGQRGPQPGKGPQRHQTWVTAPGGGRGDGAAQPSPALQGGGACPPGDAGQGSPGGARPPHRGKERPPYQQSMNPESQVTVGAVTSWSPPMKTSVMDGVSGPGLHPCLTSHPPPWGPCLRQVTTATFPTLDLGCRSRRGLVNFLAFERPRRYVSMSLLGEVSSSPRPLPWGLF